MSKKISHLPAGNIRLEKAMARFWKSEEIPFPYAFHLYLTAMSFNQRGEKLSENRMAWMRERHGEGAKTLRAATRTAFAAVER